MRPPGVLRACGKRGVVLVFTLLIMLLLMVITLGFATFTTADAKATDANWEQTTCYFLAEAGLDYGLFLLKRNMAVYPTKAGQILGVNPGALVNLTRSGLSQVGQDHVLLSDLSYTSSNDWLGAGGYVGGFHVSIASTVPPGPVSSGGNGTASEYWVYVSSIGSIRPRQVTDLTQFYAWPPRAQRTVQMQVKINTSDTAQNRFTVERYYEKFR